VSPVTVAATESAAEARAAGQPGIPPAIEINHVSKTFRLPKQRYSTLNERVLHQLSPVAAVRTEMRYLFLDAWYFRRQAPRIAEAL
jgi:hypothetical protein